MTLLEPHNWPFALALVVLVLLTIAQILGASDLFDTGGDLDMDLDMDVDIDADMDMPDTVAHGGGLAEGLTGLLALGRVPLLIWLASFMLVFAITGVLGQWLIESVFGAPLPAMLAALAAGAIAVPLNGVCVRPVAAIIPEDETSAVALESLVRRDAEIQIGIARQGSPARSKVIDGKGHPHFVMVEPHDPHAELAAGETVLLVRREGQTFFAVRYESPLLQP